MHNEGVLSAESCQRILVTSEDLYVGDYTRSPRAPPAPATLPDSWTPSHLESIPVIQAESGNLGRVDNADTDVAAPSHVAFQRKLDAERARNGFLVDYVIHVQQGVGGPHSIEVKLANVKLLWPFLADLQLVFDIVAVFSQFAHLDFVHRNMPCTHNSRWMFVNVILPRGKLIVVSPSPLAVSSGGASWCWLPAVALRWDLLRIGYDWGGCQESVLLVSLKRLSASLVKRIELGVVQRGWNYRSGLAIEPQELLRPSSGQIRWQAARSPGNASDGAASEARRSSAGGSAVSGVTSRAGSIASQTSRKGHAQEVPQPAWTAEHEHKLTAELDSLRIQLVMSSRWYLKAVLGALAAPAPARRAPPPQATILDSDEQDASLHNASSLNSVRPSVLSEGLPASSSQGAIIQKMQSAKLRAALGSMPSQASAQWLMHHDAVRKVLVQAKGVPLKQRLILPMVAPSLQGPLPMFVDAANVKFEPRCATSSAIYTRCLVSTRPDL